MRGISKRWPPKDVSPEGQTPRSLSAAERAYLAELPTATNGTKFARAQFDALEGRKLRAAMYSAQGSLCIYCERRIQEGTRSPRIDHWRPLDLNHDLALHWKNLYLCCPSTETCDGAKRQTPLKWDDADPDLPWPTDCAYEKYLGFTNGGEVYVRADANLDSATRKALELAIADQKDGKRTRKAILNLNDRTLVEARKAAMDSARTRLEKVFKNRTASRDERNEQASALLARNPLEPFVSIRVSWLRKTLGKGKGR
jgi:uncharacterized protein (TIGR02646 family)